MELIVDCLIRTSDSGDHQTCGATKPEFAASESPADSESEESPVKTLVLACILGLISVRVSQLVTHSSMSTLSIEF